ncbi:MAG: cupredoxin domain-containing protein [Actinomycetota bacterium]
MPRVTQNKLLVKQGFRLLVLGGIVTLVFAACGGSSDPAGDVSSGPAEGDAIVVVADDTKFKPDTLEASPGEEVTVEVRNEDDIAHDFAIEELELNTGTIEPGDVASATFEVPDGGTPFVCTFHPEMTGTITPES